MSELKPCPFCGRSVNIYYSSATNGFYVIHDDHKNGDCILLTPMIIMGNMKSLRDAYDAWNRREDK